MLSPASLSRRVGAALVAVAVTVVFPFASGATRSRVRAAEATASAASANEPKARDDARNPYADRFPNVVLKTHEGKNVRFYDDLLKGKIVVINFMYATCKGR